LTCTDVIEQPSANC